MDRSPIDRAMLLAKADPEIRKDVEVLLAQPSSGAILDQSAANLLDQSKETQVPTAEARSEIAAINQDVRPPPAAAGSELQTSRPWFLWLALTLGALVFGCYTFGVWIILRHGETAKLFGWEATLQNNRRIVSGVDPSGAAAGTLRNGDRLLAFNEDKRAEQIGPELFMYFLPPGSAYTIRVWRSQVEPNLNLALKLPKRPTTGFVFSHILGLIPGLICLLMAMFMAWLRPNYKLARLGFALFIVESIRYLYLALDQYIGVGAASALIVAVWWISENWPLGLAYHFLYRFFANVLPERLWSILQFATYGICTLFCAVNAVWASSLFLGPTKAIDLVSRNVALLNFHDALVNEFRHGFEAGAFLIIVTTLVSGYRRVKDSGQRRRVRWFVFGSILAAVPFIACAAFFLATDLWHGTPAGSRQWGARLNPVSLSLVIVPLVLTYAVVKHRILGIEVVIRQGVRYLLARNVLRVILLMPIVGLLLPIVRHPERPLTDALGQNSLYLNLALLIALSASFKYRGQLRAALDRKFFRDAYDQELVLSRLIGQIGEIDSLTEISVVVSRQLASTMHLDSIFVFYRENARSEMRLRCTSSGGPEMGPAVPDDLRTLRLTRESRKALDISELNRAGLPSIERDWLDRMGAQLVVPIGLQNQPTAGLLVMGEKRSEEPYGPADRKLLLGIAGQMAVVYERVWLREQVEADRRLRNEVYAHVDADAVDLLKECPVCGACYDHREETCSHDGGQLTHTLPVARTIESRYRLDWRIGQGGMGAVYQAMDLRLHRKVAIKVLVGRLFGNLPALRRFEREAEACARLTHPNIIAIHDFGRIGQEGAYLVMERLYGGTLRSELNRNGMLSPMTTAEWFDQFLNGLQAAHKAGIAHRDLKPENVFITRPETGGDRITILDFGLAKLRLTETPDLESLTVPGTVMGTVGYMSPEQLSGQASDELSDLFSTGVMIFECITGTLPFKITSYAGLLRAISQDSPTAPGDSFETLRLNGLLRKCLAPNRGERFQTADEVQCELLPAVRAWSRVN